jgi:hypothetical protein
VRRIMAWLGRELGGLTNQAMAKQLHQEPAVLSRGLGETGRAVGQRSGAGWGNREALRPLEEGPTAEKINTVCPNFNFFTGENEVPSSENARFWNENPGATTT